jgi:hypothetical protein
VERSGHDDHDLHRLSMTLADDMVDAQPGTWVHMPARLEHSLETKTPVVMLLGLSKCGLRLEPTAKAG